jgi:hypothetical protein
MSPDPKPISTKDARGGVTHNNVRYVLAVSLILAIVVMAMLFGKALVTNGHTAPAARVTQT